MDAGVGEKTTADTLECGGSGRIRSGVEEEADDDAAPAMGDDRDDVGRDIVSDDGDERREGWCWGWRMMVLVFRDASNR